MATKETVAKTLEKVGHDEPCFLLRAQDRLAPKAVTDWAVRAEAAGVNPAKILEAVQCSMDMENWQKDHITKLPD